MRRRTARAVAGLLLAVPGLVLAACSDEPEAADTTTTTAAEGTTTTAHLPGTTRDCTATGTFSPPDVPPISWTAVAGTVTLDSPAGGPPAFYQFTDGTLRVTAYSPNGEVPATVVAQVGGATYQSPLDSDTGVEVDEEGTGGTVAVELVTGDGAAAPIDLTFDCGSD